MIRKVEDNVLDKSAALDGAIQYYKSCLFVNHNLRMYSNCDLIFTGQQIHINHLHRPTHFHSYHVVVILYIKRFFVIILAKCNVSVLSNHINITLR